MPFSALSRLVRRLFRSPTTRPISKPAFKPSLEALDLRAMPALFTWTDATGDNQFSDPYNWGNTAGVLSIPGPGDDILFPNFAGAGGPGGQSGGTTGAGGPSGGSADCYGMQSSSGGPFNSITLTAGYTGTVTVTGPVQTNALYLNNGTIDQPAGAGSDITVLGGATPNDNTWWLNPGWDGGSDFYWTGGTLDSTNSGATLHITGSSTIAVIAPQNAGSQSTGDTLSFEGGATAYFLPGNVNFTGGDGIDIAEGSSVEDMPTPKAVVTKSEVNKTDTNLQIKDLGSYTVTGPGSATSDLPITIPTGILSVVSNATATFQGDIFVNGMAPLSLGSVVNSGGTVIIESGSTLEAEQGMTQASGMLRLNITQNEGVATLDGDLLVGGGTVQFTYVQVPLDGPKSNLKAKFVVTGDVIWSGGTYIPWIDVGHPGDGSRWIVKGSMTTTSNATIAPQFINAKKHPNVKGQWPIIITKDGFIHGPLPAFVGAGFKLYDSGTEIAVKR